jgi:hypothetical protein
MPPSWKTLAEPQHEGCRAPRRPRGKLRPSYHRYLSCSVLGLSPPPPAFPINVKPGAGAGMTICSRWKKRESWLAVQRTPVPIEIAIVTTIGIERIEKQSKSFGWDSRLFDLEFNFNRSQTRPWFYVYDIHRSRLEQVYSRLIRKKLFIRDKWVI